MLMLTQINLVEYPVGYSKFLAESGSDSLRSILQLLLQLDHSKCLSLAVDSLKQPAESPS